MDTKITTNTKLLDLAKSAELFDQSEKIGTKFNLHLDQIGELDAEIRNVIRGYSKASDFVNHLVNRLEIDERLAGEITTEVNKEIFQVIKNEMQSAPTQAATDISALEQIGRFTIEPQDTDQKIDVTAADRPKILNDVENPKPATPTVTKTETDLLVDHLLGTSVVSTPPKPEIPISSVIPKQEVSKPSPQVRSTNPYREPIN